MATDKEIKAAAEALINEQRKHYGMKAINFIDPALVEGDREQWKARAAAALIAAEQVRASEPVDADDLNEALYDAVCDGEGRTIWAHVARHLEKRGYALVKSNRIVD